ncbi:hypothetical protein EDC96DRAFT_494187 [Choanephora cucurbitarum]|nr:hypothetical protein EDC96DRAFT_494187 [Choanephora cucurbitarum]
MKLASLFRIVFEASAYPICFSRCLVSIIVVFDLATYLTHHPRLPVLFMLRLFRFIIQCKVFVVSHQTGLVP